MQPSLGQGQKKAVRKTRFLTAFKKNLTKKYYFFFLAFLAFFLAAIPNPSR